MNRPIVLGLTISLIVIFVIIIIIILFNYYIHNQYVYNDTYKFDNREAMSTTIPKVIIQTYHDKSKIPQKVFENIKKFAPEYKHIIFDDDECIVFLKEFDEIYGDKNSTALVDRFKSFKKGAHKADLFRYCYLYHFGGIYIDIKTILIRSMDELNLYDNTLYTAIARNNKSIYQGIIAVYPHNPFIGPLINQCIDSSDFFLSHNYQMFLIFFYRQILKATTNSKLSAGKQPLQLKYNIHLFQEKDCPISDCGRPDRYRSCTFIHDEDGNKIFQTRYADFPW